MLSDWEHLIAVMSAEGADTGKTYTEAKARGFDEAEAILASIIMNGTGNLLIRTLQGMLEPEKSYLEKPFARAIAYMQLASMTMGKEAANYRLKALENAEMMTRGSSDRAVMISWIICTRYRHRDVKVRSNTWLRYSQHLPDLLNIGQRDAVSLTLHLVNQRLKRGEPSSARDLLTILTDRLQRGILTCTPEEQLEMDQLQCY